MQRGLRCADDLLQRPAAKRFDRVERQFDALRLGARLDFLPDGLGAHGVEQIVSRHGQTRIRETERNVPVSSSQHLYALDIVVVD